MCLAAHRAAALHAGAMGKCETPQIDAVYWDGAVAECGIATGFHSSTVVGELDAYLAAKW